MRHIKIDTYEREIVHGNDIRVEGSTWSDSVPLIGSVAQTVQRYFACGGDYADGGDERVVVISVDDEEWGTMTAPEIRAMQAVHIKPTHENVYSAATKIGLDVGMIWDTPERSGCDSVWAALDLALHTRISVARAVRAIFVENRGGVSSAVPHDLFRRVTPSTLVRQH